MVTKHCFVLTQLVLGLLGPRAVSVQESEAVRRT